jgi:hypothetical protein
MHNTHVLPHPLTEVTDGVYSLGELLSRLGNAVQGTVMHAERVAI